MIVKSIEAVRVATIFRAALCFEVILLSCFTLPIVGLGEQLTYFGNDQSRLDLTNAHAARNSFVATLSSYAEETMEAISGQEDPTLFAGTQFEAMSDFDQVYNYALLSVSPSHALLDDGPPAVDGPGFDDWIQFSQPVTAFGSYFAQGGDGSANLLTLRLENSNLGTSKDVVVGTLGPGAPFYNIFFFGVTDTDPFDRVTMVESLDYDGMLLDNTIAGLLAGVLPGDFNGDGVVNAVDYPVWRDHLGSSFDLHGNGDEAGDSHGVVDAADYFLWRMNYGSGQQGATRGTLVPEPASAVMLLTGLLAYCRHRTRADGSRTRLSTQ